jgi:tripartite-type tricarboxylate transporter receptor subunit TctC
MKLNVEINKALRSSHVTQRYSSDNLMVSIGSPEDFAAFIRKEQGRWEKVVKQSGMKIE